MFVYHGNVSGTVPEFLICKRFCSQYAKDSQSLYDQCPENGRNTQKSWSSHVLAGPTPVICTMWQLLRSTLGPQWLVYCGNFKELKDSAVSSWRLMLLTILLHSLLLLLTTCGCQSWKKYLFNSLLAQLSLDDRLKVIVLKYTNIEAVISKYHVKKKKSCEGNTFAPPCWW